MCAMRLELLYEIRFPGNKLQRILGRKHKICVCNT
uniref:Uncharacterized protein n=1 Tax=Rhizophora mucronata TaxID=61149 RepID=A0A2P2NS08_RHIMU